MKELTLYVTDYCPYCHAASAFVRGQGYPHQVIPLDNQPELRAKLAKENAGWQTVPMIFVGDEFIGGYTDMMALAQNGELTKKLNA